MPQCAGGFGDTDFGSVRCVDVERVRIDAEHPGEGAFADVAGRDTGEVCCLERGREAPTDGGIDPVDHGVGSP